MSMCRFCGSDGTGILFAAWVKPTFTDHDKLWPGDFVCQDCLFWLDEASVVLQARMGKERPQRMRNYSHFVVNGEWIPLSKGDKARMRDLLLTFPFPEMAAVAESGQKHIVFRARRNPPGQTAGWVQFEEHSLWLEPSEMKAILATVEELYQGFSKTEIASGRYAPSRILKFGLAEWQKQEQQIGRQRGSLLLQLALFLAQKKGDNGDGNTQDGRRVVGNSLAGDTAAFQKPLSAHDMGTV